MPYTVHLTHRNTQWKVINSTQATHPNQQINKFFSFQEHGFNAAKIRNAASTEWSTIGEPEVEDEWNLEC